MTVSQKSLAIQNWCDKFPGSCRDCPIFKSGQTCYSIFSEKDVKTIENNYRILFGDKGVNPENPYWQLICKLAEKQRKKGIETYGQGIESNPMNIIGRLEYLEEELIDALMYCEWIKDKLMEGGSDDKA